MEEDNQPPPPNAPPQPQLPPPTSVKTEIRDMDRMAPKRRVLYPVAVERMGAYPPPPGSYSSQRRPVTVSRPSYSNRYHHDRDRYDHPRQEDVATSSAAQSPVPSRSSYHRQSPPPSPIHTQNFKRSPKFHRQSPPDSPIHSYKRSPRKRRNDGEVDLNDDEQLGLLISSEYVRRHISSEQELTAYVKKLPLAKTPKLQPLVQEVLDPYLDQESKSVLLRMLGKTAREVHRHHATEQQKQVVHVQGPPVPMSESMEQMALMQKGKDMSYTNPLRAFNPYQIDPTHTFGRFVTIASEHFLPGVDFGRRFFEIRLSYARKRSTLNARKQGVCAIRYWGDIGSLLILDALSNKEDFGTASLFGREGCSGFRITALHHGNDRCNVNTLFDFLVDSIHMTGSIDEHLYMSAFKLSLGNAMKNIRRYVGEDRSRRQGQRLRTLSFYLNWLPRDPAAELTARPNLPGPVETERVGVSQSRANAAYDQEEESTDEDEMMDESRSRPESPSEINLSVSDDDRLPRRGRGRPRGQSLYSRR